MRSRLEPTGCPPRPGWRRSRSSRVRHRHGPDRTRRRPRSRPGRRPGARLQDLLATGKYPRFAAALAEGGLAPPARPAQTRPAQTRRPVRPAPGPDPGRPDRPGGLPAMVPVLVASAVDDARMTKSAMRTRYQRRHDGVTLMKPPRTRTATTTRGSPGSRRAGREERWREEARARLPGPGAERGRPWTPACAAGR